MNSHHASVYRQIIEEAEEPRIIKKALDTGAGGKVFGPNYFDQNPSFVEGKYEEAKEPKKHLLLLRPQQEQPDNSLLGWARWLKGK
mmetsp:Transcript_15619/g.23954  ORF Transcript_15619/g.23954 Transcript_15619/m.23954 type:complete len:86 (-) Transcript_15619:31-288(-)